MASTVNFILQVERQSRPQTSVSWKLMIIRPVVRITAIVIRPTDARMQPIIEQSHDENGVVDDLTWCCLLMRRWRERMNVPKATEFSEIPSAGARKIVLGGQALAWGPTLSPLLSPSLSSPVTPLPLSLFPFSTLPSLASPPFPFPLEVGP